MINMPILYDYVRFDKAKGEYFPSQTIRPERPGEEYAPLPKQMSAADFNLFMQAYRKVTISPERSLESFLKFLDNQKEL